MNPEKQRIAIARACGWENSQTDSKTCYNPHGEHCYWSDVPDYLNDLNAMDAAVLSQSREFNASFSAELYTLAGEKCCHTHHLTAQDWADTFIKVYEQTR